MSVFRVVFLGTPDFAAYPLEALAQDNHFEIVQVVSQPDRPKGRNMNVQPSPVKEVAIKLGLPVVTAESVNTPEFISFIRSLRADVAIVIAFGQIVSQEFLDSFPYKAVNVHGSLLPLWRGAAPIQRSVQNGDSETGVALQIMVQKLDAGPILGVRKIPILESDTSSTVYEKLKKLSCDLLKVDLVDYLRGNLTPLAQDEEKVTVAKKIKKEEGNVNWSMPAQFTLNTLKAFDTWPGIWTFHNSKMLKIIKAQVVEKNGEPGKVLSIDSSGITVGCGKDSLKLTEVQLESKSKQSADAFLRGYSIKVGEFFKNG